MNKKDYVYYDQISNSIFINLWSETKEKNEIQLNSFDRKNEKHLTVLHIASILSNLYNKELKVEISKIGGFLLKRKTKIKFTTTKVSKNGILVPVFIHSMENRINDKEIFKLIYLDYFKRKEYK